MTTPNLNPGDDGSMAGVLRSYLRAFIREHLDDMLPARVTAYDDATNRASVQPLIMIGTTDGQKVSRSPVHGVPVFRFGGGGFFMRYPIKPGDFGWLKANDRDTSLMFQRGGLEDWPNTERLHSFSDAMFFPDTIKDWAIDGANANALVLQSMDGTVSVALHDDKITISAPDVVIVGAVEVTGTLTNNGVNVGSTHTHPGVTTGMDSTGGPQ